MYETSLHDYNRDGNNNIFVTLGSNEQLSGYLKEVEQYCNDENIEYSFHDLTFGVGLSKALDIDVDRFFWKLNQEGQLCFFLEVLARNGYSHVPATFETPMVFLSLLNYHGLTRNKLSREQVKERLEAFLRELDSQSDYAIQLMSKNLAYVISQLNIESDCEGVNFIKSVINTHDKLIELGKVPPTLGLFMQPSEKRHIVVVNNTRSASPYMACRYNELFVDWCLSPYMNRISIIFTDVLQKQLRRHEQWLRYCPMHFNFTQYESTISANSTESLELAG